MGKSHPLVRRWPGMERIVPLVGLGSWPTPVDVLPLPCELGNGEVWIKREDLSSPRYGGNKVRKLELLLADSNRPVLTFGPLGSDHVLATAVHAKTLGRSCTAILTPQPMTRCHGEVFDLVRKHCAHVVRLDRPVASCRDLARLAIRSVSGDERLFAPTVIPPGGSSALGVLGSAGCGLELAEQIAAKQCPKPRTVYVALGTGGTAAGLALGLALAGLDTEVRAVRVATRVVGNAAALRFLARRCLAMLGRLGLDAGEPALRISVEHRFAGSGYSRPTQSGLEAVELAARFGVELETTYTGKAFAALLDDLRSGRERGPSMFVNTYGAACNPEAD